MIVNKDILECVNCHKIYGFEASKPYSKYCLECGGRLKLLFNEDCDTELAEKRKNEKPYDPTKDPKSPYYIAKIECPYCHSMNTKKISNIAKAGSVAMFGIFSQKVKHQWHCNSCNSDF